jgi:biopolymer transport protein ExbD
MMEGDMATAQLKDDVQPMAELNTTPLIDVMLVLLIMFIITMPLQTHAVKVDLPGQSRVIVDSTRNTVALDAAGVVRWNGTSVDRLMLRRYLEQTLRLPVEPVLEFRPDAGAHYVDVDSVLADIKRSGVSKLGLVGNDQYKAF